jgi:hypothetical protein
VCASRRTKAASPPAQSFIHCITAGILAEQDVSARDVVGEAVDRLRAAQAAGHGPGLEEHEVPGVEAALDQGAGKGEAGHAGAEDGRLQRRGVVAGGRTSRG